jgi:hypothetical protein
VIAMVMAVIVMLVVAMVMTVVVTGTMVIVRGLVTVVMIVFHMGVVATATHPRRPEGNYCDGDKRQNLSIHVLPSLVHPSLDDLEFHSCQFLNIR